MSATDADLAELVAMANSAMVVVTAATARSRGGCLMGFHTQSSIDPCRYTVYLSKKNHTVRVARRASHLVVHFLDEQQRDLASVFGELTDDDAGVDKFARVPWHPGPDGRTPLLDGVDAWLFGRIVARRNADGDHVAYVLAPEAARAPRRDPSAPLRYAAVRTFEPGHPA
jgi:flavin reductase (DIM6/NTAB) family NADH-FMN oxidoreductase RutF